MKDIPNFSQWVIQALESEDGRTGAAIDRSAANRRRHIRDLEDVIEDMINIADDLKRMQKNKRINWAHDVGRLEEVIRNIADLWKETLTIRRRQS